MAAEIVIPLVRRNQKHDILKLVEWKAKEGDRVRQGKVVLIAESEKATHEIDADLSGFLHIIIPAGEKAMVGTVVGLVVTTKEELAALQRGGKS